MLVKGVYQRNAPMLLRSTIPLASYHASLVVQQLVRLLQQLLALVLQLAQGRTPVAAATAAGGTLWGRSPADAPATT